MRSLLLAALAMGMPFVMSFGCGSGSGNDGARSSGDMPPADAGRGTDASDAGAQDAAKDAPVATDAHVTEAGHADAAPGSDAAGTDASPAAQGPRVIAYLPNYSGSYSDWAKKIDFTTMTHLNLAFASATSSNGWDMGASDADVAALVSAAHAAGVKVLASLGGGGGDQTVIARYKDASNLDDLVAQLDTFVAAHGFDGVDVDIEDPANLGAAYSAFVDKTVATLRPEGKLVTAAIAQYLQDSMQDATLHEFDFLNVMIYSSYSDSVGALDYYASTKNIPRGLLALGAGFFGNGSDGNEYSYSDILAADGSAWSKDQAQVNGVTVTYTGVASMKKLADYSRGFGGIMFWELSEDTSDSQYSLYKAIQGQM